VGQQQGALPNRRQWAPLAVVVPIFGAPVALFWLLRAFPEFDPVLQSAAFHVVVVGGIAACALAVAVAAAVAAVRVRRAPIVYLAVGCVLAGGLMLGHGFTTPTMLGQPMNLWVGRLPSLALFGFALALAATLLPANHPLTRVAAARPHAVVGTAALVVAALALTVVRAPHSLHGHAPVAHEDTIADVVNWAAIVLLATTAFVYYRRWRLSRDTLQLTLSFAAAMSASACISFEFGRMWHLSWWDYHVYLLLGFGAAVVAITREYRSNRTVVETLRPIVARDPFEQIAARYTESLRPLVAAVEAKDSYTHGHSARAAEFATRLGVRLRLDPATLRAVAEGTYLHDIGKIAIPDAILNKPGALTEEERLVIEQHPVAGYEIAKQAASLAHALPVIHSHHERWDGRGYPHGLAGREIPLVARVAAVADVWDALTSERAYRQAWTEREALAHLLAGRGAHFDPVVVDALESVLHDLGIAPRARPGESAVVHRASEVCHHLAHDARAQS
jgi:HD-GYP domain-containing protein (c-di-GMP phosphodiesterase class II)